MILIKRLILISLIGLIGLLGYQIWWIYQLTSGEPGHYFQFEHSCMNVDDEVAREAFIFGKRIQSRLEESDLKGLYQLVNDELKSGPRKAYIKDKDFEGVISDVTVNEVLVTEPLCNSTRDGLYHLGKGLIWYEKVNGNYTITTIHGAEEPRDQSLSNGWQVDSYVLPPECISIDTEITLNECITTARPYTLQGNMVRSRLSISESINYIGDKQVALEVCENYLSSANERCVSSNIITFVSIAGNQEENRYLLLAIVEDAKSRLSMKLLAEYPTRNIALNTYDQDHKTINNISFGEPQTINPILNSPCSFRDFVLSKGAFNPLNAYNFGNNIIESIDDQDFLGFASLIQDELVHGPMKSEIISSGLGEFLDEKTKQQIINNGSTCQMYSDGIFSLGLGGLYFKVRQDSQTYQNVWDIYSLPTAKLSNKPVSIGSWVFNGQIMSPECFSTEWASSDNYQEYAEQFGFKYSPNMSSEIGHYFGREINMLTPIMASWGQEISLARSLKACSFKSPPIYDKDYFWPKEYLKEKSEIGGYRVIGMFPNGLCEELAPNVDSFCLSAAVVDLYNPAARHPYSNDYYAFGLFLNEDGEKHILPLRSFSSLNSARSYVEKYKSLSNKASCLIDGDSIELEGTVELETFPGPPNYESIENGDKELKYWILSTNEPVNCAYRFSFEKEKLVDNSGSYRRFQLADGDKELLIKAEESGKGISVIGELMSSHTGYHQTDFLLFVKDNKLASK